MPNDTIERGIKKAAGDGDSVNYVQVTYEGYGPSGTAIIVDALTDNKNRTAANVRNAFTKGQGSAEVTMIPQTYVSLTDEKDITNIQRILDLLDEDDDVQEVYHNWEE